jgi:hypothetical protein
MWNVLSYFSSFEALAGMRSTLPFAVAVCAMMLGCGHSGGARVFSDSQGMDAGKATGKEPLPEMPVVSGDPDPACVRVSSEARLEKKPVDIIVVVDNSRSMRDENDAIERTLNDNLAMRIGNSGLDYRVILVSAFGGSGGVCIAKPLSQNETCSPRPGTNKNGERFFHYDLETFAKNGLKRILETHGQWQASMRKEAVKAFIHITDDDADSINFDRELLKRDPANFGTAEQRNYTFHAIVGVVAKANAAEPYTAKEPLVLKNCSSAESSGSQYQQVAMLTGGLRFPVCSPDRYGTVFEKIAEGVTTGAQVACEFGIPAPPVDAKLDNRIYVDYSPSGGGPNKEFIQVRDAAACAADKFYVKDMKVVLCPDTCAATRLDNQARVNVRFTCESGIN